MPLVNGRIVVVTVLRGACLTRAQYSCIATTFSFDNMSAILSTSGAARRTPADTGFVDDQGDLEDKIVLLHEQLDKAHEKKEKQIQRLQVAQEKYHESQRLVDTMQSDIMLQNISGLEGQTSMRVSTEDLLSSDDIYSVKDRILELKLLNKDLLSNIKDARKVARTWRTKVDKAEIRLREKNEEIEATPAHESHTILEAKKYELEAREELRNLKHDKLVLQNTFEQENLLAKEQAEVMEAELSHASTDYNNTKRNIRKIERDVFALNTKLNCMEERKKFFLEKLKPLIGNESVLRIGKFALVLLSLSDMVTTSREHCSFI